MIYMYERIANRVSLLPPLTADDEKEQFDCPQPSGNFADPATCRKFYQVSPVTAT
jgi:hypothetical protein